MTQSLAKKLLQEELKRRRKASSSGSISFLKKLLSPIQLAFLEDSSRFKIARCGRRGGKTFVDAVYLIVACLVKPNTPTLYLGLTRDSAKEAIWDLLVMICQKLNISFKPLESKLRITFDNGSFIQLFGADTPNAKNRLRGRKFSLVIVDECGFVREVDSLVFVLLPMLADFAGTICLTSSPGEVLAGLFYEADQGAQKQDWSQHNWTMLDNPHFQKPALNPKFKNRAEEEFSIICNKQFGGNWNHPAFRREYYGEWQQNDNSLVYPFNHGKNTIPEEYHMDDATYAIGLDLGSVSSNAIAVVKVSPYHREVQFVEGWKKANLLIDELAAHLQYFVDKYRANIIVADTGGYGKGVVEELKRRYGMNIQAAEKQDKTFYQRILANDLLSGYIRVVKGNPVLEEWSLIVKDDQTGDEIKGQENHLSDAYLYIYRKIYNTFLKVTMKKDTEEERMLKAAVRQAVIEQEGEDSERWFF